MANIRKFPLCLALILAFVYPAHAIDPGHYRELVKQFGERARAKDWPGAHAALIEIGRELPAPTPRFLLLNATVEMHLGHKTEAIQWLEKYAATGLTFDLAQEGNMKPLLNEEGGRKVAAQMKERSQPVEKAEFVCALAQADIMPEDIAYLKAVKFKIRGDENNAQLHRFQHPARHALSRIDAQAGWQRMRRAGAATRR